MLQRKYLASVALAASAACGGHDDDPPAARAVAAVTAMGQIVASEPIGALPGELAVGADGSAQYSIPLEVPAGRAGIQPSLALTYSSRAGNGPLGVGWGLAGAQSAITRCGQSFGRDGKVRGVQLTAEDRLCLDGNRLALVAGTDGADGAEYRTEQDTFAKIVLHADSGGPTRFEVRTKDGRMLTYGGAGGTLAATRTLLTGPSTTLTGSARLEWLLVKLEDRVGNGAITRTTYDHTSVHTTGISRYPFAGRPVDVLSYVHDGTWHASRTHTTYREYPTAAGKAAFADIATVERKTWDQAGWILDAAGNDLPALTDVTTSYGDDDDGNVISVIEQRGAGFVTTTTRGYAPADETSWLVGQLLSEQVTSSDDPTQGDGCGTGHPCPASEARVVHYSYDLAV